MKICFVADGNTQIGLGHIMRCIALGKEFEKSGHKIYFLSKYKEGITKVQESRFKLIEAIGSFDIIIIDKYNLDQSFFVDMKRHAKVLVYLDDINEFDYFVDIVVNGSLIANELGYKNHRYKKKLLLGPKYNILRGEFKDIPRKVLRKNVEHIMLTTGGSNPFNIMGKLVKLIRSNIKYNHINLHVIIGSGFNNISELKEEISNYKNVRIYENINYISEIMLTCDIAISAGGGTLYELCACGTPTIGFILADNQELIVNRMNQLGYIKGAGWHSELSSNNITKLLDILINNMNIRKNISEKQQQLVDAKGVERVVGEIIKLFNKIESI